MNTDEKRSESKGKGAGKSSAGILLVVAVLVVFALAATYLKVLFFGFILACIFLPLEKFFEKRVFGSGLFKLLDRIFAFIFYPVTKFRQYLTLRFSGRFGRRNVRTSRQDGRAEALALKGTLLTMSVLIVAAVLAISVAVNAGIPVMESAGHDFSSWARNSSTVQRLEVDIESLLMKNCPELANGIPAGSLRMQAKFIAQKVLDTVGAEGVVTILRKSGSVAAWGLSFLKLIGTFAVSFVLSLFFMAFFLQKMAVFSSRQTKTSAQKSLDYLIVDTLTSSGWLPELSETARREASEILGRIGFMLKSWGRGFFWIIFCETIAYSIVFLLFDVPYAPVLAFISACPILLPIVGPIVAFAVTVIVTAAFGAGHLAFSLTGIVIAYVVINLIVEQLFLYPTLIGGALGLKLLETLTCVMLGAIFAGVPGMLFAVPTAALLKLLIPELYKLGSSLKRNQ